MLGGLFNVQQLADQPGSQCREINLRELSRMQAMIFAIERINNEITLRDTNEILLHNTFSFERAIDNIRL